MPDATNEALETFHQFLNAVMSQKHDNIMQFFGDDAQMFSPLGTFASRLDGKGAIGKQFQSILDTVKTQFAGGLKIEPKDLSMRELADNVVLITFHLQLPGPLHRRTFVMTKSGNAWRIAHIHASVASPT